MKVRCVRASVCVCSFVLSGPRRVETVWKMRANCPVSEAVLKKAWPRSSGAMFRDRADSF